MDQKTEEQVKQEPKHYGMELGQGEYILKLNVPAPKKDEPLPEVARRT